MKNILFLLIFFSSACFGQGYTSIIFVPGTGWVSKKIVDSPWIATQLTTVQPQATAIQGTIPFSKLTGSDIIIPESQVTSLTTDLAAKAPLASPTFTGTVTLPNSAVTNAMLAGSITAAKLVSSDIVLTESQTTNLVTDLGNKQGISAGVTSATTGTMTVTMTSGTQNVFTITPTNSCTFNASGGKAGASAIFVITTSGTSSFVLTWGTNFKTTATLATGTVSGKVFTVSFVNSNGTLFVETGRTIAQ